MEKVSGVAIGDGKYGGDGEDDAYLNLGCLHCGSNHFFVEDLIPKKIYEDGTKKETKLRPFHMQGLEIS